MKGPDAEPADFDIDDAGKPVASVPRGWQDQDGSDRALVWADGGKLSVLSTSKNGKDTTIRPIDKDILEIPTIKALGASSTFGDFDGDERHDLALCREGHEDAGSLLLLFGNKNGGFSQMIAAGRFPHLDSKDNTSTRCPELVAADVDGDGASDLLSGGEQVLAMAQGGPDAREQEAWSFERIAVQRNQAGGAERHYDFREIELGDINGDGRADLAALLHTYENESADEYERTRIWLGTPDGFESHDSAWAGYGNSLRLGDLNGDGFDDLVHSGAAITYGSRDGIDLDQDPESVTRRSLQLESMSDDMISNFVPRGGEVLDVDRDGIDDLVWLGDDGHGKILDHVLVVYGSKHGPTKSKLAVMNGREVTRASVNVHTGYRYGKTPYDWGGSQVVDLGDNGSALVTTSAKGRDNDWTSYLFRPSDARRADTEIPSIDRSPPTTEAARPWDMDGDGTAELVLGLEDPAEEVESYDAFGVFDHVDEAISGGNSSALDLRQLVDRQGPGDLPNEIFDSFPYAVVSGDFDSNGYADIATCGGWNANAPAVFFGSPDGIRKAMPLHHKDAEGCVELEAGDVNDDGYDDLLLNDQGALDWAAGGPEFDKPSARGFRPLGKKSQHVQGMVIGDWDGDEKTDVAYGDGDIDADTPDTVVTDVEGNGNDRPKVSGKPMAAGDLNGDGYDDLVTIVSVKTRDDQDKRRADTAIELHFGSSDGLDGRREPRQLTADDLDLDKNKDGRTALGSAVSIADLDTDGNPELAVGSPAANPRPHSSGGVVLIFPGTPEGPDLDHPNVIDHQDLGLQDSDRTVVGEELDDLGSLDGSTGFLVDVSVEDNPGVGLIGADSVTFVTAEDAGAPGRYDLIPGRANF